jgi:hypothetical protein
MEITLTNKQRQQTVDLPNKPKEIMISTSRSNCMDVLLEVFNESGQAKSKPLQKWLPVIKTKEITSMRFTMNDFSNQPITIKIDD